MEGKYRRYQGWTAAVIRAIAIIIPILSLIYVFDVPRIYLNILVYPSQYNALFLALVLLLLFLLVPATKSSPRTKVPWYDVLLIILSLSGCLYVLVEFPSIYKLQRVEATIAEQI